MEKCFFFKLVWILCVCYEVCSGKLFENRGEYDGERCTNLGLIGLWRVDIAKGVIHASNTQVNSKVKGKATSIIVQLIIIL